MVLRVLFRAEQFRNDFQPSGFVWHRRFFVFICFNALNTSWHCSPLVFILLLYKLRRAPPPHTSDLFIIMYYFNLDFGPSVRVVAVTMHFILSHCVAVIIIITIIECFVRCISLCNWKSVEKLKSNRIFLSLFGVFGHMLIDRCAARSILSLDWHRLCLSQRSYSVFAFASNRNHLFFTLFFLSSSRPYLWACAFYSACEWSLAEAVHTRMKPIEIRKRREDKQ